MIKDNYEEYKGLDKTIDILYSDERYEEAIESLEASFERFPDFDFELKFYTIICYRTLKNYEKCIELLAEGCSKGYFYGLRWKGWDPLRTLPLFSDIEKKNDENRALADVKSKMEFKVFRPEGYSKERDYPLFMILHGDGGGCNIEDFSRDWTPDSLLEKGFLVAYVQSSNPECTGGFGWTSDYTRARKEIVECYNVLCRDYPVDRENIFLGGFSGGAMASLNIMMNAALPVRGFISLCPEETDDFNDENMKRAAANGVRLVLLEGEKSGDIPFHNELMESAKKHNLKSTYIIIKGAGHNIPENWDDIIDESVGFLLN